jgi:hypothetical protein
MIEIRKPIYFNGSRVEIRLICIGGYQLVVEDKKSFNLFLVDRVYIRNDQQVNPEIQRRVKIERYSECDEMGKIDLALPIYHENEVVTIDCLFHVEHFCVVRCTERPYSTRMVKLEELRN